MAILLRSGTLPEVWIPPAQLRYLRGLMRTRLPLGSHNTMVNNRIHAAIRRYNTLDGDRPSDLFTKKSRLRFALALARMPEQTRRAARQQWELLDEMERHIGPYPIKDWFH